MTITYPLTFPSAGVESIILRMRSTVSISRSVFTLQEQAQAFAGQRWEASINYPPMQRADAEDIIAFLASLYGREGTFLMGDPNGATARGTASSSPGTPLIKGASQTGRTLNCDGAPAGASGYLLKGDYVQLSSGSNTHLHKVLTDTNVDSGTNFTLDIWPELRESPANNAALVVDSSKGLFRLASNVQDFSIDVATFYGLDLTAVEAIEVL